MEVLVIDWKDGTFRVIRDTAAENDQDLLQQVEENNTDLIVFGDGRFKQAMVEPEENEDSGETEYSIAGWQSL